MIHLYPRVSQPLKSPSFLLFLVWIVNETGICRHERIDGVWFRPLIKKNGERNCERKKQIQATWNCGHAYYDTTRCRWTYPFILSCLMSNKKQRGTVSRVDSRAAMPLKTAQNSQNLAPFCSFIYLKVLLIAKLLPTYNDGKFHLYY